MAVYFVSHTEWILIILASILCTIFIAVLVLLIALAAKRILFGHNSSKSSKQQSMISQFKDSSIHHLGEVIVHNGEGCNSSQESGKLLGNSNQESHVSTPTSIESTTPLFKDPACSTQGTVHVMRI